MNNINLLKNITRVNSLWKRVKVNILNKPLAELSYFEDRRGKTIYAVTSHGIFAVIDSDIKIFLIKYKYSDYG